VITLGVTLNNEQCVAVMPLYEKLRKQLLTRLQSPRLHEGDWTARQLVALEAIFEPIAAHVNVNVRRRDP